MRAFRPGRGRLCRPDCPGLVCRLLFACLALVAVLPVICADDTRLAPTEVTLKYFEGERPIAYFTVQFTPVDKPFLKEPPLSSPKVHRARLHAPAKPDSGLAMLWAMDESRLYVDLNSNGDLTDDTNGVFSAQQSSRYHARFESVRLPLGSGASRHECLVEISLYAFQQLVCNVSVRSFYQGQISLAGRDWQVGIIESLSGDERHLLLRPASDRERGFFVSSGGQETVPMPQSLFFNGQLYDLSSEEQFEGAQRQLRLTLRPKTVPLGEVRLLGGHIRRLQLQGDSLAVLVDQPESTLRVPTGSYQRRGVVLEANGVRAVPQHDSVPGQMRVEASQALELKLGGPLTNVVDITRNADRLQLDYRLVGGDGENYRLLGDRSPPGFRILREGKEVAAGSFEFG